MNKTQLISYIVYEESLDIKPLVKGLNTEHIKTIPVLDARSAVYFAAGISAQNDEIVYVVISAAHSRSAFAGMTEAFYRQLQVVLITLGNDFDYSVELNDVVNCHKVVWSFDSILNIPIPAYPAHIELINENAGIIKKQDAADLLLFLSNLLTKDYYLYISYGIKDININYSCKVVRNGTHTCSEGHLSNVLGASLAQKREKYIGVVTEQELVRDINALGNINMNDRIMYIVILNKRNIIIEDYACSLGFHVKQIRKKMLNDKVIEDYVNYSHKSILFISET